MNKDREFAEEVFKPGALVSGRAIELFGTYIAEGIRPPRAVGKDYATAPDNVCFALLSSECLPDRYEDAFHYGPGSALSVHRLAVVVSTEKLLAKFPSQVFAVGEVFRKREYHLRKSRYSIKDNCVFDIPISDICDNAFLDEVRLYPSDVKTATVTKDLWDGIVVDFDYLKRLSVYLKEQEIDRAIPVFTPFCRLVTKDVRTIL